MSKEDRLKMKTEKLIQKAPKYTEKDYQYFSEVQKNIPSSYRWGRWVLLLIVGFEILGLIHGSTNANSNFPAPFIFWGSVGIILDMIGLIGLMKFSARKIDIYASYLFACVCFAIFGLLLFLIRIVAFGKFNIAEINVSLILVALFVFAVKLTIVFNKKSRDWIKANRVMKGVVTLKAS